MLTKWWFEIPCCTTAAGRSLETRLHRKSSQESTDRSFTMKIPSRKVVTDLFGLFVSTTLTLFKHFIASVISRVMRFCFHLHPLKFMFDTINSKDFNMLLNGQCSHYPLYTHIIQYRTVISLFYMLEYSIISRAATNSDFHYWIKWLMIKIVKTVVDIYKLLVLSKEQLNTLRYLFYYYRWHRKQENVHSWEDKPIQF